MPLRRYKREDGAKRRATLALPRIAFPLESQPEKSPLPSQVCSTLNSGHCHVARHRRAVHVHPTRAQFDPGSVWLRNLLLQTGRGLDRPKRRAL